jgi:hypothetical protein
MDVDVPAEAGSSLHAFLARVREHVRRAGQIHDVDDQRGAVDGSVRPFLTVVLRTQGRRPAGLRDALLCLQAQSDPDFEVVVVLHHPADPERADVAAALDDLPARFGSRVRVVEVAGGGRARPLNTAFAVARGHYVSFLDDDDLVLGHWMETFAETARKSPGQMLRAVCTQQAVVEIPWADDHRGIAAAGPLVHRYSSNFDLVEHLAHNRTPFMAYAFPRSVFHDLGLRFDETLDICEDWDFELRAALLVGVAWSDAVTCVYRRWVGGDSSYTRHTAQEWRATERLILARLDAEPHLFPAGTITRLREVADLPLILSTHDAAGEEERIARIADLESTVEQVYTSRSWKLTRPLRAATALFGRRPQPRG